MKKVNYIALAVSLITIITVFLPWFGLKTSVSIDSSGFGSYSANASAENIYGFMLTGGLFALLLTLVGSIMAFLRNRWSFIVGILNIIIGFGYVFGLFKASPFWGGVDLNLNSNINVEGYSSSMSIKTIAQLGLYLFTVASFVFTILSLLFFRTQVPKGLTPTLSDEQIRYPDAQITPPKISVKVIGIIIFALLIVGGVGYSYYKKQQQKSKIEQSTNTLLAITNNALQASDTQSEIQSQQEKEDASGFSDFNDFRSYYEYLKGKGEDLPDYEAFVDYIANDKGRAKSYYDDLVHRQIAAPATFEMFMSIAITASKDLGKGDAVDNKTFYKIQDPDGYSNLRETPNGKVLRKVFENEIFDVIGSEGKFKKVKLSDGTEGYIHETRVIEVK